MHIVIVNSSDKSFTSSRFILWFGAVGTTRLMIWADHLSDAFDHAIDWIVDNAPGLLCDDEITEEFNRLKTEGKTDDEAWEESQVDTSSGGNCGNHVHSWEWGIVVENPTRIQVLELIAQ